MACDAQRVVAAEVVMPNDQGKGNYEVLLSTADGGATWTPSKHLSGTYVLTLGGDATMVGALAANLSDHTIVRANAVVAVRSCRAAVPRT